MPMDMAARAMAKQAEEKAFKQVSAKTTATDKWIIPLPNVTDGSLSVDGVKGKTLQNLSILPVNSNGYRMVNVNNGYYDVFSIGDEQKHKTILQPNKTYTVLYEQLTNTLVNDSNLTGTIVFYNTGSYAERNFSPNIPTLLVVPEHTTVEFRGLRSPAKHTTTGNGYRYMILEGDWTNKEIPPYFQGIKSVGEDTGKLAVRSTGENLFGGLAFANLHLNRNNQNATITQKDGRQTLLITNAGPYSGIAIPVPIEKGQQLEINFDQFFESATNTGSLVAIYYTDGSLDYAVTTERNAWGKVKLITSPSKTVHKIVITYSHVVATYYDLNSFSINKVGAKDLTEKVSKLEIPLSEPLRSLPNGVADEIKDGKIIRRIGKAVFDGVIPTVWGQNSDRTVNGSYLFSARLQGAKRSLSNDVTVPLVNNLFINVNANMNWLGTNNNAISLNTGGDIHIRNNSPNVSELNNWLRSNNLIILYELETPIEQPLSLPSAKSFTNGMVTVENNIWPSELTVSYSTNVVARITTSESTLSGVLAATLTLADKELAMKSVATLATGATLTDAVNKVNQILNIWR